MNILLSVDEARQRIINSFPVLETEIIPLQKVVGRVLAQPVRSEEDLPSFANSSMDGFAVRVMDVESASRDSPAVLRVVADVPAGEVPVVRLESGQAARIMTGAPLPEGGEAVVPVEVTDFHERQPGTPAPRQVSVYEPALKGDYVRPKGQDIRAGEIVLNRGLRIRPQDAGLCAMLGVANIPVRRRPKVAVLSTGNELMPVNVSLLPGMIHDSNTYTLIFMVEKYGGQAHNLGIAPDQEEAVEERLEQAVQEQADLILSSAGVSVGAFDFVRSVVERKGNLSFWRVNMRPGKPLAFGDYRGIPFIGLPGNPVSAFIGFEVFVRPAIRKCLGLSEIERPVQRVKLLEAIKSDGRESYLRGVVSNQDGRWAARLTGHQGSGNLRSLVQANALLLVPSGVKSLPIGSSIDAWLLNDISENVT